MRRPLITAHSGCMNTPLNSVQGVMEGLAAGADIIEVDIRATKDGVVVLLHDEEITTPSGQHRVQNLTFEELSALDLQERVVRLEEVLPIVREHNRIVNLDVKADNAISPLFRTVETFHMRDQVIITGCEKERAAHVKAHYRKYPVLLNASAALYASLNGDYESFVKQTCDDALAASCCGININYRFCREPLLEYAARRCLPVLVWTIDDAETMEQFLSMEVHSITSNEVRTLSTLRQERMERLKRSGVG